MKKLNFVATLPRLDSISLGQKKMHQSTNQLATLTADLESVSAHDGQGWSMARGNLITDQLLYSEMFMNAGPGHGYQT